MKKVLKTFLKVSSAEDKLYEGIEELVDDERGTITTLKRETFSTCQSCGQPIESNLARSHCPVCEGECCDFCHEQRLANERNTFERQVVLERERLRWLESKIFDGFPGIGIIRQIRGIDSMKRLEGLRRRLLRGEREDE